MLEAQASRDTCWGSPWERGAGPLWDGAGGLWRWGRDRRGEEVGSWLSSDLPCEFTSQLHFDKQLLVPQFPLYTMRQHTNCSLGVVCAQCEDAGQALSDLHLRFERGLHQPSLDPGRWTPGTRACPQPLGETPKCAGPTELSWLQSEPHKTGSDDPRPPPCPRVLGSAIFLSWGNQTIKCPSWKTGSRWRHRWDRHPRGSTWPGASRQVLPCPSTCFSVPLCALGLHGLEEAKRQGRGAGSVTEELDGTGKTPDLVTFILQEGTLRLRPTQDHQASQRQGLCAQRPQQALVGP